MKHVFFQLIFALILVYPPPCVRAGPEKRWCAVNFLFKFSVWNNSRAMEAAS